MLLSFDNQILIKPISLNNQQRYASIANEVENFQLRDLLGAAFLYDIQKKAVEIPVPIEIKTLLEGGEFTDCTNNLVKFRGLYFVLAYLNYEKYIGSSSYFDTFSGMVTKTRPEGENMTEGAINRLQSEAHTIAISEFELCKQFLNENYLSYPLWNCVKSKRIGVPKFTTLKKTIN
ncbi:MAG: hypothetical protein ACRC0V_06865 [Fusobacteriaceae bacterium]